MISSSVSYGGFVDPTCCKTGLASAILPQFSPQFHQKHAEHILPFPVDLSPSPVNGVIHPANFNQPSVSS
jgi:hypothetical protein